MLLLHVKVGLTSPDVLICLKESRFLCKKCLKVGSYHHYKNSSNMAVSTLHPTRAADVEWAPQAAACGRCPVQPGSACSVTSALAGLALFSMFSHVESPCHFRSCLLFLFHDEIWGLCNPQISAQLSFFKYLQDPHPGWLPPLFSVSRTPIGFCNCALGNPDP